MADPSSPPRSRALRTAALYALLVGAPALGVGAVLHVGQDLEAPPPVGGSWRVEPDAAGCARAAGTLRLAQSGTRVDGRYTPTETGEVAFSGRIRDGWAILGERDGCVRLEIAVVRQSAAPDSLRATLKSGACGCRTTEVTLVRAPTTPLTGGH